MPAKRALLVGCNYPGTNAALNGCINDVWGTKNMLTTYYGFTESDITVMIDTDKNYVQPTGRNMKAKLKELVEASQDGDLLVFHFSGHGTQVPSDDPKEKDGKDEAICPCDMNVITDDDLRAIFMPLKDKPGVKLTFIADCCHSGTLLDHDAVVISGPKPGGPPPPAVDVQAIQNMLAALGAGGKRELKNRALPFSELCSWLSGVLGVPVTEGNVRSSMGTIFGADASNKVLEYMKYVEMAKKAFDMLQGGGAAAGGGAGGGAKADGGMGGVLTMLFGLCTGAAAGGAAAGGAGAASQENGAVPAPPHAGAKPTEDKQLPDEVGVLITGCQDKETSADACPTGDKAKAHGALSNALHTVVKAHFDANPGVPLTSRNLVIAVRDALAKSGFAQNPCLECGSSQADSAFITHD